MTTSIAQYQDAIEGAAVRLLTSSHLVYWTKEEREPPGDEGSVRLLTQTYPALGRNLWDLVVDVRGARAWLRSAIEGGPTVRGTHALMTSPRAFWPYWQPGPATRVPVVLQDCMDVARILVERGAVDRHGQNAESTRKTPTEMAEMLVRPQRMPRLPVGSDTAAFDNFLSLAKALRKKNLGRDDAAERAEEFAGTLNKIYDDVRPRRCLSPPPVRKTVGAHV